MEANMETTTENKNSQAHEGGITKMIENYTAQVPSGVFASMAAGGIVLSAVTALFSQKKNLANFIGLWVPTLLLIGIYNKLVKLEGSDQFSKMVH